MLQTDNKLNEVLSAALTKIASDMDPDGYDEVTIDRLLLRLNLTPLVAGDIAYGLSFDVTTPNDRMHKSSATHSDRFGLSETYVLTHDKSGMLSLWARTYARDPNAQCGTLIERVYPRELPELNELRQPRMVCLGSAALVLGRYVTGLKEHRIKAMIFTTQPDAIFKYILEKELKCVERALLTIKIPGGHSIPTCRLETIMDLPDYIWDDNASDGESK